MPSPSLNISKVESVNLIELHLPETLDSQEFDQLNDRAAAALARVAGEAWVLDLTHVDYSGSSVLGFLVNVRQLIKSANGKLILCNMHPRLAMIFETSRLGRLFTIAKTRSEAIEMF